MTKPISFVTFELDSGFLIMMIKLADMTCSAVIHNTWFNALCFLLHSKQTGCVCFFWLSTKLFLVEQSHLIAKCRTQIFIPLECFGKH